MSNNYVLLKRVFLLYLRVLNLKAVFSLFLLSQSVFYWGFQFDVSVLKREEAIKGQPLVYGTNFTLLGPIGIRTILPRGFIYQKGRI